jgi:hypothetical protein
VFAVIADDVIAILAKPAAGTANHILALETPIRVRAYRDRPAASELRQRDFFDRPEAEAADEPRVMDDPPVTDIEAVMDVAAARRDEMGSQWRLLSVFQRPRIGKPRFHDAIVARRRELGASAGVKAT